MGFTNSFNPRQPHTWTAQQSLIITDYPAENNFSTPITGWSSVITAQTASSAGTVMPYTGANFQVLMEGLGEFSGNAVGTCSSALTDTGATGQVDALCAFTATVGQKSGSLAVGGVIVDAVCFSARMQTGHDSCSTYEAFEAQSPTVGTGGYIGNAYGLYVNSFTTASHNYAIYTNLGETYLGDKLTVTGRTTFNGGWARKRTTFSNVAVNVLASDGVMAQTGTMTASRVVQFPYAATVGPGFVITVIDESGTVTAINTLYLNGMGGDLLNGAGFQLISAAYGKASYISDGVGKWTLIG